MVYFRSISAASTDPRGVATGGTAWGGSFGTYGYNEGDEGGWLLRWGYIYSLMV
ncbi:hypothetical protein B0T18DRAFT_410219 [Schizothecium vesticola]|uniref:Uncharacterized protein n=1 Tax=Schizothecium vesticola TaxID=314040 RepID=A0AA40EUL7_9PEZI|nr:hypothetical protein B0T18DRAFT_410219 [Schizothecium vesticola]